LTERGIACAQWQASEPLEAHPKPDQILEAYSNQLQPFMQANGYQTADVIHVDSQTPNLEGLHQKFFKEHTHSEDEVRFFVRGQGDFWFHTNEATVDGLFCVRATAGHLLAVPAGVKHWFNFGDRPNVTVIRLFTDTNAWTPHYTGSNVALHYSWAEQNPMLSPTVGV
jgi:1,2-dihydroxy-3-keto-5-methylthiopentene dioxygenase